MTTPAHEGDMSDPFDCQEFHELCMDYRGTSKHMQNCYERLQTYCRAALSHSRALAADQPGESTFAKFLNSPVPPELLKLAEQSAESIEASKNQTPEEWATKLMAGLSMHPYPDGLAAPSRAEPIGCTTQAAVRAMTDEGTKEIMAMLNKKLCETGKAWGWIDVIRAVEDFHGIAPPVGEQP